MKIFTRINAIVLSILTLSSLGLRAQMDVEAILVETASTGAPNYWVAPGTLSPFAVGLTNVGTVPINLNDSVDIFIIINGVPFDTVHAYFSSSIAPGSNAFGQTSKEFEFSTEIPPAVEVCAIIKLVPPTVPDVNPNNDTICQTFTISTSAVLDLGIDTVSIEAPTTVFDFDINDFDFDTYEAKKKDVPAITTLKARFRNTGNVILPENYNVSLKVWLDGDTVEVNGLFPSILAVDDTLSLLITNLDLVAKSVKGEHSICVEIQDEHDVAHNKACAAFNIADSFDPSNRIYWVNGIQSTDDIDLNIFATKGTVNIVNVTESLQVKVTDITGKVVVQQTISSDSRIDMSDSAAGVYIVTAMNPNSGVMTSEKVSIQ